MPTYTPSTHTHTTKQDQTANQSAKETTPMNHTPTPTFGDIGEEETEIELEPLEIPQPAPDREPVPA